MKYLLTILISLYSITSTAQFNITKVEIPTINKVKPKKEYCVDKDNIKIFRTTNESGDSTYIMEIPTYTPFRNEKIIFNLGSTYSNALETFNTIYREASSINENEIIYLLDSDYQQIMIKKYGNSIVFNIISKVEINNKIYNNEIKVNSIRLVNFENYHYLFNKGIFE